MPDRRALLAAALAAGALAGAGCGAPDELEGDDDRAIAAAREEIDDALDTEEAIRTDPVLARVLARRVQRLAGDGDGRRLEETVPSLVAPDGEIDQAAVDAFVRNVRNDAPAALLLPAQAAVEDITEVIDDSGADGDTKVPSAKDMPLSRYIGAIDRDIRDVWPALAEDLRDAL